jgi:DNA-binding transcriptional LysR family regulator
MVLAMGDATGMLIFAQVVEANSFSEAAKRLGVSKAAVSQHVAKLERSLGARLLNRTTRRLSLTEAGRAYYEHCTRVVTEVEAAELAVSQLRSEPRGVLKVTTPVAFGSLHIAPAIPGFLARYPEVSVQMVMDDRPMDLAQEGYDLAVRLASEPAANTVARRLAPVRWVVCADPGYLRQHGTPNTPSDLLEHNCLFYSVLKSSAVWNFRSKEGETSVRVKGNFTVGSSLALREAVLRGLGVAQLPTFTIGRDIQEGRLSVLLPDHQPFGLFGNTIYAVYLPTRHLAPKVRAFVDFFLARFSPVPYWDQPAATVLSRGTDVVAKSAGK